MGKEHRRKEDEERGCEEDEGGGAAPFFRGAREWEEYDVNR